MAATPLPLPRATTDDWKYPKPLSAKNDLYLEKRPRPKKPRTANTRMTMMIIQRMDM